MIDAALVRNDVESAAFWYKKSADELTLPTEEPWHFEPKSGPWLFFGTMGIVWKLFCSSEPAELRCTFEFTYALIILSISFEVSLFSPFGASKLYMCESSHWLHFIL